MIQYALSFTILFSASFIFYWLFLKKETFYKLNRIFLVSVIALALLIPLIPIPASLSLKKEVVSLDDYRADNQKAMTTEQIVSAAESTEAASIENEIKEVAKTSSPALQYPKLLWYLYLAGVGVFTLTFIIQFMILLVKRNKLEYIQDGKFRIYELTDDSSPFSFLSWIFINPAAYDFDTYNQILEHEKIHVSQAHYLDKILAEFAVILSWFNPVAWLYRKAITNNLEFLTDSEMLDKGTVKETYQMSLLKVSVPQHALELTTNYNQSFLTERITMMNSKKSSARSSWKYLLILPMLGLFMMSFNGVISNKETEHDQSQKVRSNTTTSEPQTELKREVQIADHERGKQNEELKELIEQKLKEINKDKVKNEDKNKEKNKVKLFSDSDRLSVDPGEWMARTKNGQVCFYLDNSDEKRNSNWTMHQCFDESEISGFKEGEDIEFEIRREPGKLVLAGDFNNGKGLGDFTFKANKDFQNYIESITGDSFDEKFIFQLFLSNTKKDFVQQIKKNQSEIDMMDIVNLAIHVTNLERLKDLEKALGLLDEEEITTSKLVEMAIHGLNEDYVKGMTSIGFEDTSYRELLAAKIHGVTPDFMNKAKEYGFSDLSIKRATEMNIHNIDFNEIDKLKSLGYEDLTTREVIDFGIHNVSGRDVEQFAKIGYKELTPRNLVNFSIHKVTPKHVNALAKLGYTDLSPQELINTKIHNIDADYVSKLKDVGLENLSIKQITEFSIHNISSNYVKELKRLGLGELSANQIVTAKIHRLDAAYVEDIKALNVKGLTFDTLKDACIHRVDKRFIQEAREKGYNPSDLSDYIRLKIHGLD